MEYIGEGEELTELKTMLLEGTVIESRDEDAMVEMVDIFRWTEWQKNEYRYGLSLNTLPGIAKPFIQPIMSWTSKNWSALGESGIIMFETRLESEMGYILIKKQNPEAIDFVNAGQIYTDLMQSAKGYALRPAVQVLETFDAMKALNSSFQSQYGEDGEVILIIGVQKAEDKASAGNPRHLVADILLED